MISWWWLLIVAPIAFGIGFKLGMKALSLVFRKSIEEPGSEVLKILDPAIDSIGRQTFETAAQVAEAHQMGLFSVGQSLRNVSTAKRSLKANLSW